MEKEEGRRSSGERRGGGEEKRKDGSEAEGSEAEGRRQEEEGRRKRWEGRGNLQVLSECLVRSVTSLSFHGPNRTIPGPCQ